MLFSYIRFVCSHHQAFALVTIIKLLTMYTQTFENNTQFKIRHICHFIHYQIRFSGRVHPTKEIYTRAIKRNIYFLFLDIVGIVF